MSWDDLRTRPQISAEIDYQVNEFGITDIEAMENIADLLGVRLPDLVDALAATLCPDDEDVWLYIGLKCDHGGTRSSRVAHGYLGDSPAGTVQTICDGCGLEVAS